MKAYLTQQVKFTDGDILTVVLEGKELSISISQSRHGFIISAAFPLTFRRYDNLSWEIEIDEE